MDFKRNFELEGFQNGSLSKWKEVKRRDPSSPWYGFLYKGENRKKVPYKLTKKGKRSKSQRKLNFSQAATHDLSWARATSLTSGSAASSTTRSTSCWRRGFGLV